ncbi:PqiC family protein [Pseudomonas mangrovi]|uniref:ABC-type transport auxiliary lipoprotein component domain-containing protein n=1 Tax=Pseudomonas mangrovi TaxID=2161748 RepID=A0A2T5P8S4_9PSED|nr:ABC-type transport auxiliary lipoprotein family protein [Pseudomonas mangrovi]PTU74117.1 hypothetical protein DBO85_12220 [Pseudomonas mangrovi]
MKVLRLPLLLATLSLLQTGCALIQQPVSLYRLDAGEAAAVPEQSGELAVQLNALGVAEYLRGEALLQRQADGSLVAARDARWAGPLSVELSEQVLAQLAWRLNTRKLVSEPLPAGFKPDVQVGLEITRLDSGPTQPAVLEARWRLQDRDGQLQSSRVVRLVEEHQGSPADQVRAQSQLMQRLVSQLVDEIRPITEQPVKVAEPAPKPAPPKPPGATERGPLMPVPIRTDVEVFRF